MFSSLFARQPVLRPHGAGFGTLAALATQPAFILAGRVGRQPVSRPHGAGFGTLAVLATQPAFILAGRVGRQPVSRPLGAGFGTLAALATQPSGFRQALRQAQHTAQPALCLWGIFSLLP
jgi:hypothetical protein